MLNVSRTHSMTVLNVSSSTSSASKRAFQLLTCWYASVPRRIKSNNTGATRSVLSLSRTDCSSELIRAAHSIVVSNWPCRHASALVICAASRWGLLKVLKNQAATRFQSPGSPMRNTPSPSCASNRSASGVFRSMLRRNKCARLQPSAGERSRHPPSPGTAPSASRPISIFDMFVLVKPYSVGFLSSWSNRINLRVDTYPCRTNGMFMSGIIAILMPRRYTALADLVVSGS